MLYLYSYIAIYFCPINFEDVYPVLVDAGKLDTGKNYISLTIRSHTVRHPPAIA